MDPDATQLHPHHRLVLYLAASYTICSTKYVITPDYHIATRTTMSDLIKKEIIKEEYEPEGFLEDIPIQVPQGFDAPEWEKLTGVFITDIYHTIF